MSCTEGKMFPRCRLGRGGSTNAHAWTAIQGATSKRHPRQPGHRCTTHNRSRPDQAGIAGRLLSTCNCSSSPLTRTGILRPVEAGSSLPYPTGRQPLEGHTGRPSALPVVQLAEAKATASAPAGKRNGHVGSVAARQTASATSIDRVIKPGFSKFAKTPWAMAE